jgi:hypothetical protein
VSIASNKRIVFDRYISNHLPKVSAPYLIITEVSNKIYNKSIINYNKFTSRLVNSLVERLPPISIVF